MWSFRSILMITASLMKGSNLCPDLKYNDLKRYLRGRQIGKLIKKKTNKKIEIRTKQRPVGNCNENAGSKNRFRLEKQQLFCDARLRRKTPYFEILALRFLFLCNMVIRALTVFAHCLHWVTVWFRTCNINYCFSM